MNRFQMRRWRIKYWFRSQLRRWPYTKKSRMRQAVADAVNRQVDGNEKEKAQLEDLIKRLIHCDIRRDEKSYEIYRISLSFTDMFVEHGFAHGNSQFELDLLSDQWLICFAGNWLLSTSGGSDRARLRGCFED